MSHLSTLLSRPSTLGLVAFAGSGAFYLGLKSKTIMAQQQARGRENEKQNRAGASTTGSSEKSYEVRAGREGGGV